MKLSIVIPARNEARIIPATLINIYSIMNKYQYDFEIIVISDNSKDNTHNIAESFGCKVLKVDFCSRAKSRNFGASITEGDIIVFLDADTILEDEFFEKTINEFKGELGLLWYNQYSLENSFIADIYFFILNLISNHRPVFSPVISIKRDYFFKSKFDERLQSLEDYYYMNYSWKLGKGRICSANIWTSIRRIKKFGYIKSIFHLTCAIINPYKFNWRVIND